ncbi:MAG: fasciclin domain-containing protein [Paludibacter sp.]|nr:fasciclin domain-containing protein [Paludibacter sp.]
MKKYFKRSLNYYSKLIVGFLIGSFLLASCSNPIDELANHEPVWLGASIYDYLKTDGHFNNYVRLIEDLKYTEVLSKTGSKTLFVANDSAFNEFYKSNEWGVSSYDQLTLSQKKLILNYGMINDAYLVEMLSNYNAGVLKEGAGMRKVTAVSVLDSLPFVTGSNLPKSSYWDYYRGKGMYLLQDNTLWTTMYFTQKHLDQAQITNNDFSFITGTTRVNKDAHIFGIKVIKRDITCKNGYLNVLDKVLIPPVNMAQYISHNPKMTVFSKILDRFCAPFFDEANTLLNKQTNVLFNDSIFVKKYFAKIGGSLKYPNALNVNADLLLPFDPGWNSYTRNSVGAALESDMAAMFVPNDEAMNTFLNSGSGKVLKDRFGSWDDIPTEVLPLFIKRHMRNSLVESVPSRFYKMVDEDNSSLPVKQEDIVKVFLGSNGVVFETNKAYPPDDYSSVYGPVLLSANDASQTLKTKIWKWAITQKDFRLYLNSMVSRYSFFVPTDEYFTNYIDPIAYSKDVPAALKYWYNTKSASVNATVYKYDKATGTVGDSLSLITNVTFISNRLEDLLNMHIVVDGVETGKNFYLTKGNVALKVSGSGENLEIQGGGNIALNQTVKVTKAYTQSNGTTYFIDKPIQSPLQSVFKVLSQTPEFKSFFDLMSGFPLDPLNKLPIIFVNKSNYYGIDYNIKFFNTFNYTVYVPTNAAIQKAFVDGIIKPWDSQGPIVGINDLPVSEQAAEIVKLERFLRYHFQDNSVFIDGKAVQNEYQSATMKLDDATSNFGTFKNKYYKIGVNGNGTNLTLTTETNKSARVMTETGLYNIMTRDFVFNNKPSSFKNIDGTGAGTDFSYSSIYTSSTAVIHQIDEVLNFK